MSNLRKLMSQLKISKDDNNSNKKDFKNLFMKDGCFYRVRFLPYIDNNGEFNIIKNVWYHYINNEKIECNSKNCSYCKKSINKQNQKFVNIKLIETDDTQYNNNYAKDYFIFNMPYSFYQMLDNYEKTKLISIFDIFGSPEVILKAKETVNKYNTKYIDLTESFITEEIKPISENIENFKDEDIIAYIKSFTYNLDEEVKSMFKNEVIQENQEETTQSEQAKLVRKEIEVIETKVEKSIVPQKSNRKIDEDLTTSINNIKINLDDINLNLDSGLLVEDVEEKKIEEKIIEPIKEKVIIEDKKPIKKVKVEEDDEINNFINSFMEEVEK